jgi:hypothetical protein
MRYATTIVLSCSLLAAAPAAADRPLDCSRRSLADAVANARAKDPVITFTGVCAGPVLIQVDGVTLQGVGDAIIDGGGQDAVTIAGAGRVSLAGIEIRNGLHGVVVDNGAHVSLSDVSVHHNLASGVSVRTGSSAALRTWRSRRTACTASNCRAGRRRR